LRNFTIKKNKWIGGNALCNMKLEEANNKEKNLNALSVQTLKKNLELNNMIASIMSLFIIRMSSGFKEKKNLLKLNSVRKIRKTL
jgi:hypothetical protein